MKFYTHPWSNHAARVAIVLKELNIDHEEKVVDLMSGENRTPTYLALNPNAKVPAIDDNGFVLWESHSIMKYLCGKYGNNALYPTDAETRAHIDKWLDWSHTRLNNEAVTINFNNVVLGENGNKEKVQEAIDNLSIALEILDDALQNTEYLCGKISIADISIYSSIIYIEKNNIDLKEFTHVSSWLTRMNNIESVQQAYNQISAFYQAA